MSEAEVRKNDNDNNSDSNVDNIPGSIDVNFGKVKANPSKVDKIGEFDEFMFYDEDPDVSTVLFCGNIIKKGSTEIKRNKDSIQCSARNDSNRLFTLALLN